MQLVPDASSSEHLSEEEVVVVSLDGNVTTLAPLAGSSGGETHANVAADRDLPFGTFMARATAALRDGLADDFFLITALADRRDTSDLGPYGCLAGPVMVGYRAGLRASVADGLPAPARDPRGLLLAVLPQGESARLVAMWSWDPTHASRTLPEALPLGDSDDDARRRKAVLRDLSHLIAGFSSLVLAPTPEEPMGRVVLWVSMLAGPRHDRIRVVLTNDRATLDQPPDDQDGGGR
jgi:hypothetical protein